METVPRVLGLMRGAPCVTEEQMSQLEAAMAKKKKASSDWVTSSVHL